MTEPHPDRDTPIKLGSLGAFEAHMMACGSITTHGILRTCTRHDVLALPSFGEKRLERVKTYAQVHGFHLRETGESLQACAAEVYGNLHQTPVEVIIIHLIHLRHADVGRISSVVVASLKSRGVVTIGDFRKLDISDFERAVNKYSPLYHSLTGWLLGAGIISW